MLYLITRKVIVLFLQSGRVPIAQNEPLKYSDNFIEGGEAQVPGLHQVELIWEYRLVSAVRWYLVGYHYCFHS